MKIYPTEDRLLVEIIPAEKMKGHIYLPATDEGTPKRGIVSEVGPGTFSAEGDSYGKLVPRYEFKKGQKVLLGAYSGIDFEMDGRNFRIVKQEEILAILEEMEAK